MPTFEVSFHDEAFQQGFKAAMDGYRELGDQFAEFTADKVVAYAKELVPKRTGRLAESIHREALKREGLAVSSVEVVAGGPGIREAIFMEYGTYKDRPHPYMRPAMALAAGGLRSVGIGARLAGDRQAKLFVRRQRARVKIQRAQRRGLLKLSPAEARVTGRFISRRFQFRQPRKGRRRA